MMLRSKLSKRCLSLFMALLIVVTSLFTFSAFPMVASAATQATYYVSPTGSDSNDGSIASPFQTIEKARDVVRTINQNMTGDIYVYLRGGDYRLTSTINFGLEDSGTNGFRIYYQAYQGETPVLNGSTKVTGWTKSGTINGIDGIYEASLDRSTKLRYLFVNDKRAQMTKLKATGKGGYGTYTVTKGQADWAWTSGSNSDGVKYNLADVPEITNNKDDLEIVNGSTWNENVVCTRDVITSSDGLYRVLQLQQPYGAIAQLPGWGAAFTTSSSNTIYNAIEFMKNPGEFYFDKTAKKLYYYPRAGEDMTSADVEAPFVEKLIDLKGDSNTDRIKNITFKGITFANTDWSLMKVGNSYGRTTCQSADGYIAYYNDNWHNSAYTILDTYPGMINIKSADSIDLTSNVIKHSGADGVSMVNDVINSNLVGNYIYDITASGITVGHPQHVYLDDTMDKSTDAANNATRQVYATGVEGICTNDVINNNMLWDCSTAPGFGGCAGITSFFSDGLKITYNTVHTSGYNGITLGWGWCNFQNSTSCKDNDISYNRVYNALNRLHDSGAIYTIGQMPGTKINNNYVNGIPDKSSGPTYGLHNDEGTTYIEENNNVLDISPNVTYTINCEDYGQKHHLTILNTYATVNKMGKNPPNSTIDVPVVVPDNVWPLPQYNIALNAGVQEEYRSIVPSNLFATQDYVFPASCSVQGAIGSSINIRSSGDAANSVWFAPAGTTSFAEGATMTKAAGTATSIAVPSTPGTYKLFVVDSGNSVVGESKAILRVNATDGVEIAPQADDFKTDTLGSQWSVLNPDNTKLSMVTTDGGIQITTQEGDIPDGSIKNLVMQSANGDWVADTKVTLSAAQSAAGQQVGLVAYGDNKNFVKLTYERVGSNSVYGLYNTLDGTKTTISNTVTLNNQLVHYFRLVKSGAKYSAYYSTDNINYNLLGSTASSIDPKLGLIACNGTATASINAIFGYLKLGSPEDIDKDASLSEITVDGTLLSGFSSTVTNYSIFVADSVTTAPTVTATPVDPAASVLIQDAASLPGTTTITVSNGYSKKVYSITFGSTMKYEAEDATFSGGAKAVADHNGYTGTGFAGGFSSNKDSQVSFNVNAPSNGKYTLLMRYVNGKTTVCENIGLYVNGTKLKTLSFPVSSNWDTWSNLTQTITLNSGANTVALKNDIGGNGINLDYITVSKVSDQVAPTWPENSTINVTNLSETGLTIIWPVAVDNTAVTSYKIYKGTTLLTTVAGTVNSYNISGLIAGTDYAFKVEAGDAVDNWSEDGPSAAITTLGGADITAPTWPQDSTISASNIYSNGLTITWTAAQDDRVLSNYRIYKGSDLLATVSPAAINCYDVSGLTADTEYTFKIEAGDSAGNWSTNGPVNILKTNSSIKIEAETATLTGTAGINSTEHKGFSGTGYVDGNNSGNAKTTFNVNMPSAGIYTVTLRYATSNTNASTNMGLYVNGTKIKNITCNKTANWDTWDNEIETVTLNSGANTIAYNSESYSWDCINIDYIIVTRTGDLPSDTTAPTWAQGSTLEASKVSSSGLTLTWTAAQDDTAVTGYKLYKGSDVMATVAGDVTNYDVAGLTSDTEYTFKVEAGDGAGNLSTSGPSILIKTLNNTSPTGDTTAPTWNNGTLSASGISKSTLTLTWTLAQDDTAVTGYKVYKDSKMIATVGNVTTYNVTGLASNTAYTFSVEAGDAAGNWSTSGPAIQVATLGDSGAYIPPTTTTTTTTPVTTPVTTPTDNTEVKDGVINAQPKVTNGVASTEVTKDMLDKALSTSSAAKIVVSAADGAKEYVQTLPVSSLQSSDSSKKITIETPVGTAVVPVNALKAESIQQQTVDISLAASDSTTLSQNLKNQIGNRPVVDVDIKAGGNSLSISNPLAPVAVSVDYKPTAEELKKSEHIVVWSIGSNGEATPVTSGKYDAETGKVTFNATEPGTYAVTYVEKKFEDTYKTKWAEEKIEVLASKGIVGGTSETTFSPQNSITRAEYLTLLMKSLGLKSSETEAFDDVKQGDYYFNAVATAKMLGITNGTGDNKFNPSQLISRQDMIVLTEKALEIAKEIAKNGSSKDLEKFSDKSEISSYAVESIANFVNSGLINGSNGNINPRNNATRAEAAVIIYKIYNK